MTHAAVQLSYVYWAYAIGIAGTLGVSAWSWVSMHRAEARRDRARGR